MGALRKAVETIARFRSENFGRAPDSLWVSPEEYRAIVRDMQDVSRTGKKNVASIKVSGVPVLPFETYISI